MRIHTLGFVVALLLAAGAQPGLHAGQPDQKAADVMAAARRAIGGQKLSALKTFSADATVQRNVGSFQMNSDVQLVLELPDKYARTDVMSSPMAMERTTGFNSDQPIARGSSGMAMSPGGGMMIRMGGPAPGPMPNNEKPTPEQQEQMNKSALRSARVEVSRLMLGWFAMAHTSIAPEYTYAGQAEAPDGKADVIDVKGADGFAARLFIDAQTHLPLLVTYRGTAPRIVTSGGPGGGGMTTFTSQTVQGADRSAVTHDDGGTPPPTIEFRLFFSDWAEADGIKFPHKIQRSMGDTIDEEWTFTKVKVNPKVDPKKFQTKS